MKVSDALLEGATRWRDTGWVVVEHLDACVGHAVRGVRALTSGFAAPHPHEMNHSAVAQQTTTTLVDDLDDTLAANETVAFGLDGTDYEIDLNAEHATALREDLATWVDHARRTSGRSRRSPARTPQPTGSTPSRSGTGRAATATRSPTAAASPPPSKRPSTPPTDIAAGQDHHYPTPTPRELHRYLAGP